eukprot:15480321-Alexandrium_andersonii.AAC.1
MCALPVSLRRDCAAERVPSPRCAAVRRAARLRGAGAASGAAAMRGASAVSSTCGAPGGCACRVADKRGRWCAGRAASPLVGAALGPI